MKNSSKGGGRRYANAIRALSMDAVQKANSGHPGAPMGMADIAAVLWREFLRHNPRNPSWANRDRFVLSNGHGSMLLYALLHLSGYDVSIEDLKQFRQLHSKTPGHPEYGYTPGVETTTGPLGQGLANAVGMALAERMLAARFNRAEHVLVDHFTYVFVGDGCLMEGISHEVCSLAGTLGLGKLIVFYDDNGISIDGEVEGWFTDDTAKRFESYGWQVIPAVDGHDEAAIRKAIKQARAETNRPSLISCKTVIGFGAPNKQGKEVCHGAPLGEEEITLARKALGWEHAPFEVPEEIYKAWSAVERGQADEAAWQDTFEKFSEKYPREAAEWTRRLAGELPADWETQARALIQTFVAKNETVATRKASQQVLQEVGKLLPELVGGSADLAGSNLTIWNGSKGVNRTDYSGNYIYYGVREFGMAAMMNGMALHGGFIPYGGTFLIFSDYARNALRMAALMNQRCIFVLTHDSIGLGEDGPTHQPIEQLASLRMIPNMSVWRPCDQVETMAAWKAGLERRDGPTVLALSRQNLPPQARSVAQIEAIERGAYVLLDCVGKQAEAIVMASGSEVELALQAVRQAQKNGYAVRLVSMPALDVFDRQDHDYQEQVLPSQVRRRLAVEAGVSDYWRKYVGLDGKIIGLDRFGESAPAKALFEHFGYTLDNVIATIESLFH